MDDEFGRTLVLAIAATLATFAWLGGTWLASLGVLAYAAVRRSPAGAVRAFVAGLLVLPVAAALAGAAADAASPHLDEDFAALALAAAVALGTTMAGLWLSLRQRRAFASPWPPGGALGWAGLALAACAAAVLFVVGMR